MILCLVSIIVNGCGALPYYNNAQASISESGDMATVTCAFGHRFNDGQTSKNVTCLNGGWITVPACLSIL